MRRSALIAVVLFCHIWAAAAAAQQLAWGPGRPPSSKGCTGPYADSLVTDRDAVAYLQMCSSVKRGFPTTLNIVRYERGRAERSAYQLRAIKPKLLSIESGKVSWLQVGPDLARRAGSQVEMIELDLATGRTAQRGTTTLPFEGALMQVTRGDGCVLVRAERGLQDAVFIAVSEGRMLLIPAKVAERAFFWDAPTASFALAEFAATTGRAVDCHGRAAALGAAAAAVLAKVRDKHDRFLSAPSAGAIAYAPLGGDPSSEVLSIGADARGRPTYLERLGLYRIHALAAPTSGDRIAVVGDRSIEIIGPADRRRSIGIPPAAGWNMQVSFLKNSAMLVALDRTGASIFDTER